MSEFWTPPGMLCSSVEPEGWAGYACALCGSAAVAGVLTMDPSCARICLLFDVEPTILPGRAGYPANALLVGEARVNGRPAVFCGECYAEFKRASLARGGTPWPEEGAGA